MELQKGDKVLITSKYGKCVSTVKNITTGGKVRLENSSLYYADGRECTSDVWNTSSITLLTEELREELRKEKLVRNVINKLNNLKQDSITYEQALKINAILFFK